MSDVKTNGHIHTCRCTECNLIDEIAKLHAIITKISAKDHDVEIAKLKNLLIIRDGGGHDVDCKANYNRQCNCGHDSVEEYFKEVAK